MVNTLDMDALCVCGHSLAYHPMEESCNSCHGGCEAFRMGGAPAPLAVSDLPPMVRRMLAESEQSAGKLDPAPGFWLVYHSDWSGIAVFREELEALRHAVKHGAQAEFHEWGPVRGMD